MAVLAVYASAQQAPRSLEGNKLSVAPKIDGVLDEDCWKVEPSAKNFVDIYSNAAVADQTEVWLAYDDKALYLAWYCHDTQPDQIIGRQVQPGTQFEGEDFVVLRIDPFHTKQQEHFSRYQVNTLGTQNEEIAGGRASKAEWRGVWQSASKRVADGYIVEMAVPWAALNYGPGKKQDMGINFVRVHGRLHTKSFWSNVTPSEKGELNGTWTGVTPPQKAAPKAQILAYTLAEVDRTSKKNTIDAGLDIQYPITTQMTLVGSVNPDFKNVEQAVQSVAATRGERFLGDTRPFFAEGSQNFNLTEEFGIGRAFYSRRIKDFDFGVKSYGYVSPGLRFDSLVTNGDGETNSVVRLRQEYGNSSRFQIFGTSHQRPDRHETVSGGSFSLTSGQWSISAEAMREQGTVGSHSAAGGDIFWQMPKLFLFGRADYVEPGFKPKLGLVSFDDKKGFFIYSEFNDEYKNQWIRKVGAEGMISRSNHFDHTTLDQGTELSYKVTTRNDQEMGIGLEDHNFEGLRDRTLGASFTLGATNKYRRWSIGHRVGRRSSEKYNFTSLEFSRRIFGKLDLRVATGYESFQGHNTQEILTAAWEIDAKRSVSGRIVRENHQTNAYFAYRSSGFSGKELFVILGDPNVSKFKSRLAIKMVWPFST